MTLNRCTKKDNDLRRDKGFKNESQKSKFSSSKSEYFDELRDSYLKARAIELKMYSF